VHIGINITNGASEHAASFYIANVAGKTNKANLLAYEPDSGWTRRTNSGVHYMLPISGPSSQAKERLKFYLAVEASVPADLYRSTIEVAGIGNEGWGQKTDFFIEVVPATANGVRLESPLFAEGHFSCTIATTPGITYFLEYKQALAADHWIEIGVPSTGDGSS